MTYDLIKYWKERLAEEKKTIAFIKKELKKSKSIQKKRGNKK